ncbi:hypothetical protein HDU96_006904 [Phlyctochytrium bullatum]|nr:hypothetical protein HDU96_006904 [Phlyctochytrium bullatum]
MRQLERVRLPFSRSLSCAGPVRSASGVKRNQEALARESGGGEGRVAVAGEGIAAPAAAGKREREEESCEQGGGGKRRRSGEVANASRKRKAEGDGGGAAAKKQRTNATGEVAAVGGGVEGVKRKRDVDEEGQESEAAKKVKVPEGERDLPAIRLSETSVECSADRGMRGGRFTRPRPRALSSRGKPKQNRTAIHGVGCAYLERREGGHGLVKSSLRRLARRGHVKLSRSKKTNSVVKKGFLKHGVSKKRNHLLLYTAFDVEVLLGRKSVGERRHSSIQDGSYVPPVAPPDQDLEMAPVEETNLNTSAFSNQGLLQQSSESLSPQSLLSIPSVSIPSSIGVVHHQERPKKLTENELFSRIWDAAEASCSKFLDSLETLTPSHASVFLALATVGKYGDALTLFDILEATETVSELLTSFYMPYPMNIVALQALLTELADGGFVHAIEGGRWWRVDIDAVDLVDADQMLRKMARFDVIDF